jgi:hypothetical protein
MYMMCFVITEYITQQKCNILFLNLNYNEDHSPKQRTPFVYISFLFKTDRLASQERFTDISLRRITNYK